MRSLARTHRHAQDALHVNFAHRSDSPRDPDLSLRDAESKPHVTLDVPLIHLPQLAHLPGLFTLHFPASLDLVQTSPYRH